MIASPACFGRSKVKDSSKANWLVIAVLLLVIGIGDVYGIGSTGWYSTRIKCEYQFTDYNSYQWPDPIPPEYPDVEYTHNDPYIADFPELRTLVRITQAFGPTNVLQLRYQYSDLTDEKTQRLYYVKFARDVSPMVSLYLAYQVTELPDWFNGYMVTFGVHRDQSGWILGDGSLSYFRNHAVDGNVVETYIPNLQLRYSLNSVTALTGRWEAYYATGENGSSTANVFTVFVSRYLPTQTAIHLSFRYYHNTAGLKSHSPALEVAQYILWNLTLRVTYRHYWNENKEPIDDEGVPIETVRSNAVRGFLEWQIGSDLKLHFKLRRYVSNQDIKMNTYLFGFEYTL